jgi:hypothetical protein
MKDKDSDLIWEASREPLHWSLRQDEIKQKQQDAEISRVTCFCDDCEHWSSGNKCVAESIELTYNRSDDGVICECKTYNPVG